MLAFPLRTGDLKVRFAQHDKAARIEIYENMLYNIFYKKSVSIFFTTFAADFSLFRMRVFNYVCGE